MLDFMDKYGKYFLNCPCYPFLTGALRDLNKLQGGLVNNGDSIPVKKNGNSFRGSNSAIFFFASLFSGAQLLRKRICSNRSKFFPSRVDPILEGLYYVGRQSGSHNRLFPL